MALVVDDENHSFNAKLYNALMGGMEEEVINLCQQVPDGPLHVITIHDDTVLHMATYSKQKELVLTLLEEVRERHVEKMTCQNDTGNTILHEAATSNRQVEAAREMMRKAPKLLGMRNKRGETALFRAARYGKREMFKFLDGEVNFVFESHAREEARNAFFKTDDKTTILHMSILTEHLDLALSIAEKYEYLVGERDGDGMTALQLLACNPEAFKSGSKLKYMKQLLYSCVSLEDATATEEVSCCRVPLWEALRKKTQQYESALRLAKFLIEKDTTWKDTASALNRSKPKTHKYGGSSQAALPGQGAGEGQKGPTIPDSTLDSADTPLFLATKSGIIEIVEEILKTYPQAVEHVGDDGRNVLHVAIRYRQMHIFELVEKMEIPMTRLTRKIDNDGNSILHMVGKKVTDGVNEKMRSPALVLQEDMLLFERVKEISTTHFVRHFNNKGQTAEKLFAENYDHLRKEAKEWLKRTAENCSIVAVLIATVAFAAAYTIPGGPDQNTGYPLLLDQPFFVVFTMTDTISLTLALTSVIVFLSILTSPFRLKDFKQSLPQKLMLGITLLIFSVSMMMLAFAATLILMIHNKQQWSKIALYSVAFFPVSIFAISYLPLYISLLKTFRYTLRKIREAFPSCSSVPRQSQKANSLKFPKSRASQPQTGHPPV